MLDELPSTVWILPSASTDSTMPMCWPPQTITSPACGGVPEAAGVQRPVRCAQEDTALTAPNPWPASPIGAPACLAAHETKYEHHGPMPLPAVAVRYSAIRGESLEPGGCSVCPTSAWANCSARWPGVPAAVDVAVTLVAPEKPSGVAAPGAVARPAEAVASCSVEANAVGPVPGAVGAAVVGGTRPWCSSAILAITFSTLIQHGDRRGAPILQPRRSDSERRRGGPWAAPPRRRS